MFKNSGISKYLALYTLLFFSNILLLMSSDFKILYIIAYELILISYLLDSRSNKLAIMYAAAIFVYFYQAPLFDFFPQDDLGVYKFNVNDQIRFEVYAIYSIIVLMLGFTLHVTFLKIKIDPIIHNIKDAKETGIISLISSIIALLLLYYTIASAGGFGEYLLLNKLEASQQQKFVFWTHKDFALIAISTGLLSKNRYIFINAIILGLIFSAFEILSAKRYFLLAFILIYYTCVWDRFEKKYFFYAIFSLFIMVFLKYVYYNVRNIFLGSGDLVDLFWFDWNDLFFDLLFIGEGRAHTILLLKYINLNIDFGFFYFIDQLLIALPFGSNLAPSYLTAGEYLRIYLNEPWSGLASSQYAVPYLSFGLLGILLIYSINLLIIILYNTALRLRLLFFELLFVASVPVLFFYSQREEIILVLKNIYTTGFAILFVITASNLVYLLIRFSKRV